MPDERGSIYNRDRAKQLNNFSGLRYGTITPTDIDGLIEYNNKAYILIEIKYKNNECPNGQRIALERLTDDLQKTGKDTICIIGTHEIENPEIDVDVATTKAIMYRRNKKWHKCDTTTKEIIDNFLQTINKDKFSLSHYLRK